MPSPRAPGNESLPLSGDSPGLRVQWKVGPPISAGQNEKNTARSSTPDSSLSKKKKKREIREKIINGFDSDSEDESDIVEETKPKSKTIGEVAEGPDLDGELAALVEEQEVDELEDDDADAIEQMRQKRSVSIDDDISGELLELASGPPKKRKKQTMAPPSTQRLLTQSERSLSKSQVPPVQATSHRVPRHVHAPPVVPRSTPSALQHFPSTPNTSMPFIPGFPMAVSILSTSNDPYSSPLQNLAQSLPSPEMQNILFGTFFSDPILTEGLSLLQPQFMDHFNRFMERRSTRPQRGDATTLALTFIILASSLRILPEETNRLLLASHGGSNAPSQIPRSLARIISGQSVSTADITPLDQRYLDLALLSAQIAEQADTYSIMFVMFKLVSYRYWMLGHRREESVLAGTWLAQGIKVAQALGFGREWEGLPQGDRELRRRVMWSLYVADRQYSFETSLPYTILDAHQGIQLPSPLSEPDLYRVPQDARELPSVPPDSPPTPCTALLVHTHLARRVTAMLDSFATISATNISHDMVHHYDQVLETFQDSLPPFFKVFPMTDSRYDASFPYLPVQRVRLHTALFGYRCGLHRPHLPAYLWPTKPATARQVVAQISLSSLRVQRSARMLDAKVAFRLFSPVTVFENATTLCLIMYIDKAVSADAGLSPGPLRSAEFMSMRAGVAEALELLDMTGAGADAVAMFSKKATVVIRGMVSHIDAPLESILIPAPALSRRSTNGDIPSPSKSGTISSGHQAHHMASDSQARSAGPSPVASGHPAQPGGAPASNATPVSSVGAKSAGTGSMDGPLGPYSAKAAAWLDSLVQGGPDLERLLREAEWDAPIGQVI
ncbi:hypothetical protein I307_00280 [Cryptococcus deuterogattii 99/473]|uniref:Xylanolytic transcriptional activator regulatory domain-containing protein n=1 Tax=Cryptococcus deuterogattii Ram5 TaxID=1296110 RepID=A0A0D0V888_9TREE|nr:hypothetical protein I313_00523 [Cryptococcus deuterogattii Ram5]KIY60477.1 hypothetical protein I307_00280 [Cryptococcus deuterogattii 99/473]